MHLILQVANIGNNQVKLKISLEGFGNKIQTASTKTVLTSRNAFDENSFLNPKKVHHLFPLLSTCNINKKTSVYHVSNIEFVFVCR